MIVSILGIVVTFFANHSYKNFITELILLSGFQCLKIKFVLRLNVTVNKYEIKETMAFFLN